MLDQTGRHNEAAALRKQFGARADDAGNRGTRIGSVNTVFTVEA